MLVENFTVIENVILGAEGEPLLKSASPRRAPSCERLEREYGLEVDPDAMIEELPVGLQQRVEILKALYRGAEILILDEPTGVLTPAEADHLFRILKQLKDQGKTVVLITHKLREIMADHRQCLGDAPGHDGRDARDQEDDGRGTGRADGRPPRAAAGRKGRGQAGAVKLSVQQLTVRDARRASWSTTSPSTCAPARSSALPASPATASPS